MEENLRTNIPVPLPDREAEATDNCESESTRTESIDSGITVGSSGDFLSHNADASESTGWTDEKHSLYLNHLETSFVKQLHRSAGLCGWHSRTKIWGPFSSYGTRPRTHNSADQYTVLQDGCWQKVNFGENGPLLDQRSDSYTGLDNQWIHHFTSSSKQRIGAPPSLHESILARDAYWRSGSSRNSQEPGYDQYHDVSVDSTTGRSGQLYVPRSSAFYCLFPILIGVNIYSLQAFDLCLVDQILHAFSRLLSSIIHHFLPLFHPLSDGICSLGFMTFGNGCWLRILTLDVHVIMMMPPTEHL